MKSFKVLLLAGLVGISFQAAAEVKIHLNHEIKPIIINGEELGFSLGDKSDFELKNGQNQIVVRVEKLVDNRGEYEKFNSKPMVLTFTASDTSLTIAPDGKILTTENAQDYNKAPKVLVTDASNKKVTVKQDRLEALTGFTRDYEKELMAYNRTNKITTGSAVTTAGVAATQTQAVQASKPQEMVEYWYAEATPEEKTAFSSWAFQNRKQVSGELSGKGKPSQMLDYWYKKATPEQRSGILAWLLKIE
ncbi:YccT family protein [Vibrio rumoiensis]|uniref:Uncharacterized protein n=1 Tax=Vibrio rumoiensis 1S-45 TaxID=1188252 RepID=A0A1E5E169_9VIBR|nr:DUF2057 family protein [Vibrio rumoiensis]OEF23998.1 hypothetical protein A1QC_02280 [Vibrio rumoiensis 1S-45]